MSRYDAIFGSLWQDRKFTLLSPTAKLLLLYLRTSPHSNIIGYYHIRLEYMTLETGLAEAEVDGAMKELTAAGMAAYDDETRHVLIVDYVEGSIQGVKSFVHAMREVRKSTQGRLFPKLLRSLLPLFEKNKSKMEGSRQQEDAARFEALLSEYFDTPSMPHRYPINTPSIPPVRKGKDLLREGKEMQGKEEEWPDADEIFGKKADIEVTAF